MKRRAERRPFSKDVGFDRSYGDLGEMFIRLLLFKGVSNNYFRPEPPFIASA